MLAVMVTMLLVCVLLVMVGRNIEMDEEEWEQAGDLQFWHRYTHYSEEAPNSAFSFIRTLVCEDYSKRAVLRIFAIQITVVGDYWYQGPYAPNNE